jgi:hypothetical protein
MSTKVSEKKVSIKKAELTFKEGILYIRFNNNIDIELEDVQEIQDEGLKLSGGKPFCALAYLENRPASTPEARTFGATASYSKYRLADAIIVESGLMRLVTNIYINFNKPKVPTQMFETEEKAVAWLKTFLDGKA